MWGQPSLTPNKNARCIQIDIVYIASIWLRLFICYSRTHYSDIFTQATAKALGTISKQQKPLRDQAQARPDYSSQIPTMRKMGIVDEGLARRDLGVISTDLQVSIDLIFSGLLGEDDSAN
ncbi:unnamed protein product [Lepeophtheirus salmonis]|uniref:(salmon louse) hypothetical protein n=1 Tax=Lepeophtheirus salmonis TaxID=72036 RepID=A0A7R8CW39_LEPSM|nr:unnamed protein product [Lepeophtheirus salmonis]CAF2948638.1 unnamed protein product [Lepeophtheirus salmonis]